MDPGRNDRAVQGINFMADLRGRAGRDFFDQFHGVSIVPRIDTFRRVPGKKVGGFWG